MTFGPTGGGYGPKQVQVAPAPKEETPEDFEARRQAQLDAEVAAARAAKRAARRKALAKGCRELSSVALQLAGIAIVAYGVGSEWPWLGKVIAGLGVILVGMALSPSTRRAPKQDKTPASGGAVGGP